MSEPHDLVIRGGTIVDGTGAPAYVGDVVIDDGRITRVTAGTNSAEALEVIEADGYLVTPGLPLQKVYPGSC